MVQCIYFVSYLPLSKRIEDEYYMDMLRQQGFKLIYLSIYELVYKGKQQGEGVNKDCFVEITDYNELDRFIADVDKTISIFIPLFTYEYRVLKILRVLTRHQARIFYFAKGAVPLPSIQKSALQKLVANFGQYLNARKIVNFISSRYALLMKKMGYIQRYDTLFVAGNNGPHTIGISWSVDVQTAKQVQINSGDYDRYLSVNGKTEKIIDHKYIVFVDQYLPYHPDVSLFGLARIDAQKYYQSINRFLDQVEKDTGISIAIAAHPKADYSTNPYGRRPVFNHKTPELIKDAELVLMHNSTSVSYAILFNKPVVMLFNSEIGKLFNKKWVQGFASMAGASFIDIDSNEDAEIAIPEIDKDKYRQYKYSFLTSVQSEGKRSADIVTSYLLDH